MSCDEKLLKRLRNPDPSNEYMASDEFIDRLERAFGVKKPKKSLGQILEEKRLNRKLQSKSIVPHLEEVDR